MSTSTPGCNALKAFIASQGDEKVHRQLEDVLSLAPTANTDKPAYRDLLGLYGQVFSRIEQAVQDADYADQAIASLHGVFQEFEAWYAQGTSDDRHSFVVVIPVADRPLHLEACLNSLLELCRAFAYGGIEDGHYRKVTALIADDSREQGNIDINRRIAERFTRQGLATLYFGQEEQLQQLDRLPADTVHALAPVIGAVDRSAFYHKGPSIMRNITYLKLQEMASEDPRRLFYFIDSDQEFKVKVSARDGDRDVCFTNYFYYLNDIFSKGDVRVFTGKVVGDPPVSPSVMAGTFLDDVNTFLGRMAAVSPDTPCQFHSQYHASESGAAYHDMAGLFGFDNPATPHDYHCTLEGEHDNVACVADFAHKLNHFFDGEHPTRITYFDPRESVRVPKPARTVYTGNYVLHASALKYFVPFAALKLRMAGPTLGRIIRAEIGDQFVAANLPMLHKRTVRQTGAAEFRPGIEKKAHVVDLSGEFERQFFGDVMLFSIERLVAMGYPQQPLSAAIVEQVLTDTEADLQARYSTKHDEIMEKLSLLSERMTDVNDWSRSETRWLGARRDMARFLSDMEHNFGVDALPYQRVSLPGVIQERRARFLDAILAYAAQRRVWEGVLNG